MTILPPLPNPLFLDLPRVGNPDVFTAEQLLAYARLAMQAEREACARACDDLAQDADGSPMARRIAQAIRARA